MMDNTLIQKIWLSVLMSYSLFELGAGTPWKNRETPAHKLLVTTKSKIIEKPINWFCSTFKFDKLGFFISLLIRARFKNRTFSGNETWLVIFLGPLFPRKGEFRQKKGFFLDEVSIVLGVLLKVKYFNIEVALHMDGTI